MAENRIYTKIALKYNDYAYWTTGAGKDYIPLKGEVCFCAIENKGAPSTNNNAATTAPTVLFKVGIYDGTDATKKKFSELKWASALAADVYDWAKVDAETFLAWLDTQRPMTVDTDLDTRYSFEIVTDDKKAETLVITEQLYTKGVATGQPVTVATLDIATQTELNEALKNYYTKTEADAKFAPAGEYKTVQTAILDTPVAGQYISAVSQNANGVISVSRESLPEIPEETLLTITDKKASQADTDDIVYAVANLVESEDNYGHDITATYKPVATQAYVDKALDAAKEYADEKPHENTAHSHGNGVGTVAVGTGGITGNVGIDLNIGIKLETKTENGAENSYLVIYDATSEEEITSLNAAEFVEDSFLQNVEIDDNNILTFTWNIQDTEGKTKTTEINLEGLVDVYTGETTDTIKVTVDNYKIKAELLKQYKEIQAAVANTIPADEIHGLTALSQDENGVISYTSTKITPAAIGAAPANDYKIVQEAKTYTGNVAKTVTKIEQNTNGEITNVEFSDIAFPEPPTASGTATIASVDAANVVTLKSAATLGEDEDGNHVLISSLPETDIKLSPVAKTGSPYDLEEVNEAEDGTKYFVLDCNW